MSIRMYVFIGSARHLFHLPISAVLLFNELTTEIANRGTAPVTNIRA
jgi:hypothetical protein